MSDERPEALLKSALEKIVYFEARSEQLTSELAAAREELARLKNELGLAGKREIDLRRQVASLEVEAGRAHREREELGRVNDALRSERAALMDKIIEASRIHASDREEEQPFDLASFIAQLRSEVLSRPQAHPPAPAPHLAPANAPVATTVPAPVPVTAAAPRAPVAVLEVAAPPQRAAVAAHAERLRAEGRLHVSEAELGRLSGGATFLGRTEETLFGFSVRELSAQDPAARVRAAERLRALGQPAGAPPLATALHSERDPQVLVALLTAFGALASSEGTAIVLPLLDADSADVRIAALKALLSLDATAAGPHLSAAMKDEDRAVRRRASLLALGLSGEAALALGEQAVRDADAEVRGLGALVLGASGGDRARELLLTAMRDPERKVRKAAAQSLSRILGEDVSTVVDLDDAQRRREVRRLATLPVRPVRAAAQAPKPAPKPVAAALPPIAQAHAQAAGPAAPAAPAPKPAQRAASEELCAALLTELRCAIRGRTLNDLASLTRHSDTHIHEACELLVARGHAVRRGQKFFAA